MLNKEPSPGRAELGFAETRGVNLGQVRRKAEAAWQAKDYVQLVALYRPVRDDLSKVEAKKLAYAEQLMRAEGVGPPPARKSH